MAELITLTIDGQECRGTKGMTILQVAKENGLDIPTLCNHPWLTTHGGCRMCVVEVEGQRRLVTACAAPAEDGQIVVAHNDRLETLRQMTLELLFAERNHICPFCAMTGVCELQDRAYEHHITHTRYDYIFPVLTPDTTNPYFVQDHNRCILCGRCVRSCYEIAGVGTLGFGHRGSQEVVIADLGVPLGESSCIKCGTCVDVCPTGALFDKRAPYFSRARGLERKPSICPDDDLGCAMNVVLKSGLVARIEGWTEAPVNGPLLSYRSRYEILNEPHPRVLKPRVRKDGELVEVDWAEALDATAELLAKTQSGADGHVVGLCSTRLPYETLASYHRLLAEQCGCVDVDTFRGAQRATRRQADDLYGTHKECDFEAIQQADMVLLVGFDPCTTHPVLGAWLAKKVHHDGVPIVSISPRTTKTAELSILSLKPRRGSELAVLYGLLGQLIEQRNLGHLVDRLTAEKWRSHPPGRVSYEAGVEEQAVVRAAALYAAAKNPVILYGPDLTETGNPTLIGRLWEMAQLLGHVGASKEVMVRGFTTGANSAAAEQIGFRGADMEGAAVVYLLSGDDPVDLTPQLRQDLRDAGAVILQSAHDGPLVQYADVVLPSLKWSERGGTWINVMGVGQTFEACTKAPAGIKPDEWVLTEIGERLSAVKEAAHE
ncbi:MAG: molybdopterin-dependent oxidoreductase [Fimbriimonadaceae bacterium]|nr:molybdopterin-dependent oxidoreductase [Fimbriimonadaceae bacterium]